MNEFLNSARFAYLDYLINRTEEEVYFVSCDFGAPIFDDFRRSYPKWFVNVGIAEQNMISVACGLALSGKKVVTYAPSPFPVTRAYDQIKCAVCVMDLPITILCNAKGFAQPHCGATHFDLEDVALMRTLPNIKIITPTDNMMGIAAAQLTLSAKQPIYLSFDAHTGKDIYANHIIDFNRGFEVLREGKDVVLVSSSHHISRLLSLAERMADTDVDVCVVDLYALPYNEPEFLSVVRDKPILIYEEHINTGGLGTAILEMLNNYGKRNLLKRLGVDFGRRYPDVSGSRDFFLGEYGLTDTVIVYAVNELIEQHSLSIR